MKVLLIDNDAYGDQRSWNPWLGRVLSGLWDAEVQTAHYLEIGPGLDESGYDVLALGSRVAPWDVEHLEDYDPECDLIRRTERPIMGICGGHQLIGRAFGVPVRRMASGLRGENGFRVVRAVSPDPLFEGLRDGHLLVREFHTDCVPWLPQGFRLLASSRRCQIQMMVNAERPILGMQFHPERFTDRRPDGRLLLLNARSFLTARSTF